MYTRNYDMEKQRELSFTKLKQSDIKLCCCCQEELTSTSMWQIGDADNESYGQMLQDCFSIELDSDVDDVICEKCVSQLRVSVEFKHKVTVCQKMLKLTFIDTNKQLIFEEIKPWAKLVKQEIDDNQYNDEDNDVTLDPEYVDESSDATEAKDKNDATEAKDINKEIKSVENEKAPAPNKEYIINPDDFEQMDKKYVCKKCNKTLSDRRSVVRHLNSVHYKTPARCSQCGKTYRSQIKLNKHQLNVHTIVERRCDTCHKKFSSDQQYRVHRSKCNDVIAKLRNLGILDNCSEPLKGDKTIEKRTVKYLCGTCSEEFLKESALRIHMRTHRRENKPVQIPPKKELLKNRYKVLPEDYTKVGKQYVCNKCAKTLCSYKSVARHMNSVHYKNPLQRCDRCESKFTTLHRLIKHKFEAHNIDLRISCNACDKKFSCNYTLTCHKQNYHKLAQPKQCPHCDYFTFNSLAKHMSKHTTITKYKCKYCPKEFKRYDSHRYHERIHTGDKRMVCKICDARFVQRSSLKYHVMKSHPNEARA